MKEQRSFEYRSGCSLIKDVKYIPLLWGTSQQYTIYYPEFVTGWKKKEIQCLLFWIKVVEI